jgi:hypothetical protein
MRDCFREPQESWTNLRRDKKRGTKALALAVGDGALGFWDAKVCLSGNPPPMRLGLQNRPCSRRATQKRPRKGQEGHQGDIVFELSFHSFGF